MLSRSQLCQSYSPTCFLASNFASHLSVYQPYFANSIASAFCKSRQRNPTFSEAKRGFGPVLQLSMTVTSLFRAHLCGTDGPDSLRLRLLAAGGIYCPEG
jgi:hypothetical protein